LMEPGRDEERAALSQHASAVLAYLARRAPTDVGAVGLFRRTMFHAWGQIDRFPADDVRRQRVWLLAAAARVLARSGTESVEEQAAVGPSGDSQSSDWRRDGAVGRAERLRATLSRLAHAQRELVTLVHWDGLTLHEAAEVVGMGTEDAVGEYNAARANLRAVLEGARI
jgi:DNA-directed RNA polymerase specialized sigma24 family protein